MFFDEPNTADDLTSAKLKIAKLQRDLLLLRYDAEKRQPFTLPLKRKGIFGGYEQVMPPHYLEMQSALRGEQKQLEEKWLQVGYQPGNYWWDLPWEQLAPILLWNLTYPEEEDDLDENGCRRGFSFHCQDGRENTRLLYLEMQEHHQRLFSSRSVRDVEHSVYTKAEREAMVDAYNEKRNSFAMLHSAFANNVGVHSIDTGWDYDTAFDYYTSAEYISDRIRESEQYSQSLYQVEERHTLHVSTSSQDRFSIHGICEFHVDREGCLDYLASLDFGQLASSDQKGSHYFETKDALIIAACLLAESPAIKTVPMHMFEKFNGRNEMDVVRMAGIMTCFAHKLERE